MTLFVEHMHALKIITYNLLIILTWVFTKQLTSIYGNNITLYLIFVIFFNEDWSRYFLFAPNCFLYKAMGAYEVVKVPYIKFNFLHHIHSNNICTTTTTNVNIAYLLGTLKAENCCPVSFYLLCRNTNSKLEGKKTNLQTLTLLDNQFS